MGVEELVQVRATSIERLELEMLPLNEHVAVV